MRKMHHRQTERPTDGQTSKTLYDPFHKDGGLIMFFRNLRINFLTLFGLIVSHVERINARKKNTINIVQSSKSTKTIICGKFM